MKILSWNVNGLRAVYKRGFIDWLQNSQADFVCLQEVKADKDQLPSELQSVEGYNAFFNSAQKKGYSGVAIYAREKPLSIETKLGIERFDQEGRMIKLEYPDFTLINLYIPHGGRQKENLEYKLEVYEKLLGLLEEADGKDIVLIGDFNIAHKDIDLARPKQNRDNIMFTEEERKQLDKLVSLGFTDTFRKFNQGGGNYTWWPYMANARERNLGWRIDYAFVSSRLLSKLKDAFISCETRGSDHCPIGVELQ